MNQITDVVIIGAGHAGLSAGYYLSESGVPHFILERGRVGESWLSQRWDSFKMNTSDSLNQLPGEREAGIQGHAFSTAHEFTDRLKQYVQKFDLPVVEHCEVLSVRRNSGKDDFSLEVSQNGVMASYRAKQVIVCCGAQNEMKLPAVAGNIGPSILQLHAGEYRNAGELPSGSVLVVGSAQSGCQIAEDLATQGRKVYLSTSLVPRVPRRYRGRDIMDWLIDTKFLDLPAKAATKEMHMRAPQLSAGDQTISLQSLAKKAVQLLGKLKYADHSRAQFYGDAEEHVQFADLFSGKVRSMVDEFINNHHLNAPAAEEDFADMPDAGQSCYSSADTLDFHEHRIGTIIWATGFGGKFDYIRLPVLDGNGAPVHADGLTTEKGFYFLGLPWLRTRKSGLICGIREDAEFICRQVIRHAQPSMSKRFA